MAKNSWTHYETGNILARKQVDWSMFTWGSAIPRNLHDSFKVLGKDRDINRKTITLIYDNREYEAHIQKSRIDGRTSDSYQLRYDSAHELIELITRTFQTSFVYITSEREQRKRSGGQRPNIVTPPSIAEYIDFCITSDPTKLQLKFHPVYNQVDDELLFQTKVMAVQVNDDEIVDAPREKAPLSKRIGYSYPRDPELSKKALISANYSCEFDNSHRDFICATTNQNYVEAHHLIPLQYHEEYDSSLDVGANIVALCPSCHRKIHLAIFSEKKELIETLFEQRARRLITCNLNIAKEDLLLYYKNSR